MNEWMNVSKKCQNPWQDRRRIRPTSRNLYVVLVVVMVVVAVTASSLVLAVYYHTQQQYYLVGKLRDDGGSKIAQAVVNSKVQQQQGRNVDDDDAHPVIKNEDDDDDSNTNNQKPKIKLFSKARKDRSGAAILDMLFCHAFAFREGSSTTTYGGACIDKDDDINDMPYLASQEELIQTLGLQDELPFACPVDRADGIIMNHDDYFAEDTALLTDDWLHYIRSKKTAAAMPTSRQPLYKVDMKDQNDTTRILQVAVHVRRGDVTPCSEPERYLPNSYYLAVLDKYVANIQKKSHYSSVNVSIFSESVSFESWNDFTTRGYNLFLGTTARDNNLSKVWQAFLTADVLVMSKSSFSLVPAIFHNNNNNNAATDFVLYTPFWHKPLTSWTVVSNDLIVDAKTELKRLVALCPPP